MNRHVINGMIRYLDKLSFLRNAIPAFEAGAERMGEGRLYGT